MARSNSSSILFCGGIIANAVLLLLTLTLLDFSGVIDLENWLNEERSNFKIALMQNFSYSPPSLLNNGWLMTIHTALQASKNWEATLEEAEPVYREIIFTGAQDTLIFGLVAIPDNPKGTIIATYGITGDLDNQWFLKILGRKAYHLGYAVVMFDWRAHGKTASLSPTLTSDGIYEGKDFVYIANEAKKIGCPAPFWFSGYSLGGQLALWGIYYSQFLETELNPEDIAGGAVICPNLDANRSLIYLERHFLGKYLEKAIAHNLQQLALQLYDRYPQEFDKAAILKAKTIRDFDRKLVIDRLGFATVEEYYRASSPLPILTKITKPTLILYAADDPMFEPTIIGDLVTICANNKSLELILTPSGGHIGYLSSKDCQKEHGDKDPWWAWNRILQWFLEDVGKYGEVTQRIAIQ